MTATSHTFYLKTSADSDQKWHLLLREKELTPLDAWGLTTFNIYQLEGMMKLALGSQKKQARKLCAEFVDLVSDHSLAPKYGVKQHRVTIAEARRHSLSVRELMLGATLTFTSRSEAMRFKLHTANRSDVVLL